MDGHAASTGNTVNFRLGLPEGWNGKFLFLGVGGLGGTLATLDPGLARGYATATTDTGHRASEPDWASNRAKEIDYGYRGTHVSTVAAKALTASFYGAPPKYAYFEGCSNGGRQALMEVQRYPGRFRRRHRRPPRHRHADAGGPRRRLSADAGVAGCVSVAGGDRTGVEGQPRGVRQAPTAWKTDS